MNPVRPNKISCLPKPDFSQSTSKKETPRGFQLPACSSTDKTLAKRSAKAALKSIPPKRSRKDHQEIPKLTIWRDFEDENRYHLITKSGELLLNYLAEGNYHKVFTIEGCPERLIKIPYRGKRNPQEIEECRRLTNLAMEKLQMRTDLRVCKIYKDILEEGYYEIENVPLKFTPGDQTTLTKIREVIANMIHNPESFIFDFLPKNVHRDSDFNVVVIDPSEREFDLSDDHELEEAAECIAEYYKAWSAEDAECIQWFKEGVDKSQLEGQSAELYNKVLEKLM